MNNNDKLNLKDRRMLYKVIGMFQEVDGDEVENFEELKNRLGLIGSTSDDVGDVHLYYDNDGTTYAIAKDSAYYYGDKAKDGVFSFINKETKETSKCINLDEMLKSLIASDTERGEDLLNRFDTLSYKTKVAAVRNYGYNVLTEVY